MNLQITWSFTPADKRVWLWKLVITLVMIGVFSITYFFTGDIKTAAAATAVAAAATAVAAAVAAAIVVAAAENEKYKISFVSNLLSTILQFGLTWLGFYVAQHLQIHLSFSWFA